MGELVEIPLNSFRFRFRFRFRRLSWQDEYRISSPTGEDQRKILLSHALVNMSGLPVTSVEDARKVLDQVPPALFWRIWVLYSGNLPADGYYTNSGCLHAPDQRAHQKRVYEDEEATETVADATTRRMEHTLGPKESREARSIEAEIVAAAKRAGSLVRAGGMTTAPPGKRIAVEAYSVA